MGNHFGDLSEYEHLLAAKSSGKLKKFYGYLMGDEVNATRLSGWTRFPAGKGFFKSDPLQDPERSLLLGELYSEILFFEDFVDRAQKRIGVYKEKLNFNFHE